MTFRRILGFTLIILVMVSVLVIPSVSSADALVYTDKYGQSYAYVRYDDEGKIKVAIGAWKYDDVDSLVIPSKIDGYPVTMILEETFKDKKLESVTLPDTLEYIGEKAFWNCSLTKVTLPKNLQYSNTSSVSL